MRFNAIEAGKGLMAVSHGMLATVMNGSFFFEYFESGTSTARVS